MRNEPEEERMKHNVEHTKGNVARIRAYLHNQFQGFDIIEQPDCPLSYTFTVTKPRPLLQYKLTVSWPRILDTNHTPAQITRLLSTDNVAARMRASQGEIF